MLSLPKGEAVLKKLKGGIWNGKLLLIVVVLQGVFRMVREPFNTGSSRK
jgi:hypothetical protein